MPTYEYECTNGHTFEAVQRITDEPLQRCTQCRAKVRRLISASRFILKGSGWYSDGYSSSGGSKPKGGSGNDAGSGGKDSSGSSGSSGSSSSGKDPAGAASAAS